MNKHVCIVATPIVRLFYKSFKQFQTKKNLGSNHRLPPSTLLKDSKFLLLVEHVRLCRTQIDTFGKLLKNIHAITQIVKRSQIIQTHIQLDRQSAQKKHTHATKRTFLDTHLCPSLVRRIACSRRHLTPQFRHKSRICPAASRSCTHRRCAQGCEGARRNHRSRSDRRTSRTVVQLLSQPACGTLQGQSDALLPFSFGTNNGQLGFKGCVEHVDWFIASRLLNQYGTTTVSWFSIPVHRCKLVFVPQNSFCMQKTETSIGACT